MKKEKSVIILFLAFGIVGTYGFPYMKGTFYNILKGVLELSDLELARIWGVFGLVGMFSYIFGGYLTDRISPRKILIAALCASGILHVWVSFVPSYLLILMISALMGLAAVFAFFPASSKVLSFLGGEQYSGRVFGIYYALEGLGGLIVNFAGTRVFMLTESAAITFAFVVRFFAVLNFAGAVGICVFLPKEGTEAVQGNQISLEQLKQGLFRRKEVWLIALITMCNFWLYCTLTYITPYLTDLFGMKEQDALLCGVIRVNALALLAGILFGRMADWKNSALCVIGKVMPMQAVILGLILLNQLLHGSLEAAVVLTMVFSLLATGVKVISIVMISECHFPMVMTGTVIGIVSFVGYSPDAFTYPVVGKILSLYGETGYLMMFGISLTSALVAAVGCIVLKRIRRNHHGAGSTRVPDIIKV